MDDTAAGSFAVPDHGSDSAARNGSEGRRQRPGLRDRPYGTGTCKSVERQQLHGILGPERGLPGKDHAAVQTSQSFMGERPARYHYGSGEHMLENRHQAPDLQGMQVPKNHLHQGKGSLALQMGESDCGSGTSRGTDLHGRRLCRILLRRLPHRDQRSAPCLGTRLEAHKHAEGDDYGTRLCHISLRQNCHEGRQQRISYQGLLR